MVVRFTLVAFVVVAVAAIKLLSITPARSGELAVGADAGAPSLRFVLPAVRVVSPRR